MMVTHNPFHRSGQAALPPMGLVLGGDGKAVEDDHARLGASAIRYFFTVGLFHSIQCAGVTGARRTP